MKIILLISLVLFLLNISYTNSTKLSDLLTTDDQDNQKESTTDYLFGESVSISGNLVVIGAPPQSESPNVIKGTAYIFDCSTYPCVQKSKLSASEERGEDLFGTSVSVSGKLVAVGASTTKVGTNSAQGAAYIFDCSTYPCVQKAKLVASDGTSDSLFGSSISISNHLVAVGAFLTQVDTKKFQGVAYLFDCSTYPCVEKSKMIASDGDENDFFGLSISISGNLVVVGASSANVDSSVNQGAAYIFDCSTYPCIQKSKLKGEVEKEYMGSSVSISGTNVVVGAKGSQVGSNERQGVVYLFDCSAYPCVRKSKMMASDGIENDFFGQSISISGTTVVIGNFPDVSNEPAAYIFDCSTYPCVEKKKLTSKSWFGPSTLGVSVAISEDHIVAGVANDNEYPGQVNLFDSCVCSDNAICLGTSTNSTCSCPSGLSLSDDGKSCEQGLLGV